MRCRAEIDDELFERKTFPERRFRLSAVGLPEPERLETKPTGNRFLFGLAVLGVLAISVGYWLIRRA